MCTHYNSGAFYISVRYVCISGMYRVYQMEDVLLYYFHEASCFVSIACFACRFHVYNDLCLIIDSCSIIRYDYLPISAASCMSTWVTITDITIYSLGFFLCELVLYSNKIWAKLLDPFLSYTTCICIWIACVVV